MWIQWAYRKQLDLAPGTNLIHHYFERIGLPDWVPKSQELVSQLQPPLSPSTCTVRLLAQISNCL